MRLCDFACPPYVGVSIPRVSYIGASGIKKFSIRFIVAFLDKGFDVLSNSAGRSLRAHVNV